MQKYCTLYVSCCHGYLFCTHICVIFLNPVVNFSGHFKRALKQKGRNVSLMGLVQDGNSSVLRTFSIIFHHTHIHTHAHRRTRTRTNTYTYIHTRTYTHTHARTHARTYSCTHAHTHVHIHTRIYTRMHARTHSCTHANTRTHARTDIHTRMHGRAQTDTDTHGHGHITHRLAASGNILHLTPRENMLRHMKGFIFIVNI